MKNKIFMPISRLFKLKILEKAGSHTYRSIKILAALWSYRDGHGQQQYSVRLWSLNNTKGLKDIPTPLHQQPEQWIKDPIWSYFLHKYLTPGNILQTSWVVASVSFSYVTTVAPILQDSVCYLFTCALLHDSVWISSRYLDNVLSANNYVLTFKNNFGVKLSNFYLSKRLKSVIKKKELLI